MIINQTKSHIIHLRSNYQLSQLLCALEMVKIIFLLFGFIFNFCYFVIASGETAIEAQESAATNALEYLQMMIKWSETAWSKMINI